MFLRFWAQNINRGLQRVHVEGRARGVMVVYSKTSTKPLKAEGRDYIFSVNKSEVILFEIVPSL